MTTFCVIGWRCDCNERFAGIRERAVYRAEPRLRPARGPAAPTTELPSRLERDRQRLGLSRPPFCSRVGKIALRDFRREGICGGSALSQLLQVSRPGSAHRHLQCCRPR
jgi:hypothetical protein